MAPFGSQPEPESGEGDGAVVFRLPFSMPSFVLSWLHVASVSFPKAALIYVLPLSNSLKESDS